MLQVRKIIKSRGFKNLITVFLIFSLVIGGVFVASPSSVYADYNGYSMPLSYTFNDPNYYGIGFTRDPSFLSGYPYGSSINVGNGGQFEYLSDKLTSFLPSNSWITPNYSNGFYYLFNHFGSSSCVVFRIPLSSENGVDFSYFSTFELIQFKSSDMSAYKTYTFDDLDIHFVTSSRYLTFICYNFPTNRPNYNNVPSSGSWFYAFHFQNSKYVITSSDPLSLTYHSGSSGVSPWYSLSSTCGGGYDISPYNLAYPVFSIYDFFVHHLGNNVDDYILDKKLESQEVIEETLDDFSGNGSASVKKADTSSAKDTSNALRSGLSTGGSSSDTFEVFNITSDFFRFFSQDCYDYVNGVSDLPVSDFNSRSRSYDSYPDFISPLDFRYQERIDSYD